MLALYCGMYRSMREKADIVGVLKNVRKDRVNFVMSEKIECFRLVGVLVHVTDFAIFVRNT